MILLPYIISGLAGYLLVVHFLKSEDSRLYRPLIFFLAIGAGLGISAFIGFLSLVYFNQFNRVFVLACHTAWLATLGFIHRDFVKEEILLLLKGFGKKKPDFSTLTLFSTLAILLWIKAGEFPFGGWDAWSCWNLKARFIFLGGQDWNNLLNPVLWRSSPHYPLLLPLINAWGWIFTNETSRMIPLLTSCVFSLITAGLLFYGLKTFSGKPAAVLGALLLFTVPFFLTLSTDQYSDILIAYFLLAIFLCMLIAKKTKQESWIFLAGIFLGFLSFTKPEGTVAAAILTAIILFELILGKKENEGSRGRKKTILCFFAALFFASLPSIIFQLIYAPANQTFINGLATWDTHQSMIRLKLIFGFLYVELLSEKWNGLWLILLAGLILSGKSAFTNSLRAFPIFFTLYLGIIIFYYMTNVYFDLLWWLSITLNRILSMFLPALVFWVFYSIWQPKKTQPS